MNYKVSMAVAAAIYVAVTSLPAVAQTADSADAPAASGGLEEIVVTAQKRSENLQTVPIAVSAVTAAALEDVGIKDVTDLKLAVPALNVTNTNGRLTSSLRGAGTVAVGAGFENPVALYVDNVYYASTTASVLSLNNISQIDVLKGPQGTLFGRNATAGLIQITTRDPSKDPGAQIDLGYANYETSSASAYLGGHILPALAGDIAVSYTHQNEGWGTNLHNGQDIYQLNHDTSLRSKWVFEPADGSRFTLIGDYADNANTDNPLHTLPGSLNAYTPGAGPAPDYGYNSNTDFNSYTKLSSEGVSLRYEQDLPFATLANTAAYRKARFATGFDYDGTPVPGGSLYFAQKDSQVSEELVLSSRSSEPFSWVVGGYYFHADSSYDPFHVSAAVGANLTTFNTIITDSKAGFAQSTWEFAKNTNLTLGVRYTAEEKSAVNGSSSVVIAPADVATPPVHPPNVSNTYDKSTFRAAVDHRLTDDLFGYVSFNRGFKAGGFNSTAPGGGSFLPETLDDYEFGVKSEMLDHRLRVNAALFYYNYKDVQVQELQAARLTIINGASAHIYGLDSDFAAQVTAGLRITGGLTWVAPNYNAFPGCQVGTPGGTAPVVQGSCDDNQLPLATRISSNLGADYTMLLHTGTVFLNANAYFNDGFYTEPDNVFRQPSFVQLGVLGRWTAPGDHFSVGLFGKNLTDRRVINYETTLPTGAHSGFYQAPRTYGIKLNYTF